MMWRRPAPDPLRDRLEQLRTTLQRMRHDLAVLRVEIDDWRDEL